MSCVVVSFAAIVPEADRRSLEESIEFGGFDYQEGLPLGVRGLVDDCIVASVVLLGEGMIHHVGELSVDRILRLSKALVAWLGLYNRKDRVKANVSADNEENVFKGGAEAYIVDRRTGLSVKLKGVEGREALEALRVVLESREFLSDSPLSWSGERWHP